MCLKKIEYFILLSNEKIYISKPDYTNLIANLTSKKLN